MKCACAHSLKRARSVCTGAESHAPNAYQRTWGDVDGAWADEPGLHAAHGAAALCVHLDVVRYLYGKGNMQTRENGVSRM